MICDNCHSDLVLEDYLKCHCGNCNFTWFHTGNIKLVNLTPHALNIQTASGNVIDVAPSRLVARIATEKELQFIQDDIEYFHMSVLGKPYMTDNEGKPLEQSFPEQKDGTIYIVSGMFRQYFDREDLWQPGELLRDDSGKIVGSRGLSR